MTVITNHDHDLDVARKLADDIVKHCGSARAAMQDDLGGLAAMFGQDMHTFLHEDEVARWAFAMIHDRSERERGKPFARREDWAEDIQRTYVEPLRDLLGTLTGVQSVGFAPQLGGGTHALTITLNDGRGLLCSQFGELPTPDASDRFAGDWVIGWDSEDYSEDYEVFVVPAGHGAVNWTRAVLVALLTLTRRMDS